MAKMTIYILPTKTRGCAPQSPETTKMTKMAGVPQTKPPFAQNIKSKQGISLVILVFSLSFPRILSELIFGKGMRTATFRFSESGRFTEWPGPLH